VQSATPSAYFGGRHRDLMAHNVFSLLILPDIPPPYRLTAARG